MGGCEGHIEIAREQEFPSEVIGLIFLLVPETPRPTPGRQRRLELED